MQANHSKRTRARANTYQQYLRQRKSARTRSRIRQQRDFRQAIKRITPKYSRVVNLAMRLNSRQRDFVEGIMDAMRRGDTGYIIRLSDLYRDIAEFSEIREILNKITLRMIARNQAEELGGVA